MTKKAAVGIIAIDQKDEKEMAMKRKKPDYFQGRKRLRSTLLLTMVGIFLLGAISFQLLVQQITRSFETNIQKEVIEISRQNAETVRRELTAKQQFMLAIAEDFSNGSRQTKEQILAHLRSYAPLYQFYNMGVIESDGTGYTLDGKCLDLRETEYYQKGFQGEAMITKSYPSAAGNGEMLNIITAPVRNGEEIEYVITATYQSARFADLLNRSFFEGAGTSIVVDRGEQAMITLEDGKVNSYEPLAQLIQEQEDLEDRTFTFSYQGRSYLSHMEKLDIEDWYLLTFVEKERAFAEVEQLEREIIGLIAGLGFLISLIIAAFLFLYQHHQRKVDTILFYDELLDENNFTYYKMNSYNETIGSKKPCSILVFDIDRFQALNLFHGKENGDELLRYVNRIFKEEMSNSQLYRDYSDHFVAVMDTQDEKEIIDELQKLMKRIETDVHKGSIIPFMLSFGICTVKEPMDLTTVLINARLAKNTIKHSLWRNYAFYEEGMKEYSLQCMEMEAMFNQAVDNHEFEVYYQPKYDMRTKKVIGSEALVRWVREHQTIISPAHFIPQFERNGQIVYLDAVIILQVCQQMAEMLEQGIKVLPVSVNLSRLHLKDPWIIAKIREWIREFQLDPKLLAFEITERAFFDDEHMMGSLVKKLHALGCRVDMDDYGTGASSLQSLAHVDFDVIKLDRSFVTGIGNDKMESVIKTTIDLAQRLKLQLVAEGVETIQQVEFLLANGCSYAQGYYFAKVLSKDAYIKLLRDDSKEAV